MDAAQLLDSSLLAELRRIELRTRRSIDSDLMGHYRSAFRGSGLIFSDLREYQPGDDVRHIHWKVTARTSRPFVKTFEEDRQLNILLVVDVSNSTNVGGAKTKHRKALEFAALVTTLGLSNQDAVGLLLFSDKVEEYLPIKRLRSQGKRIISALLKPHALTPRTNIADTLKFVREHQRKRSIIFIVSDFISANFEQELKALSLRHDVIAVLLGEKDTELNSCGIVQYVDAESGARIQLDTSSKRVREHYKKLEFGRRKKLLELFRNCAVDQIEIRDLVLKPLLDLMRQRTARCR